MSFHIGDTTVSFPLDRASGQELAVAITGVMATFADKAKAERPKRWPAMEFTCTGKCWLWREQSREATQAGASFDLQMRTHLNCVDQLGGGAAGGLTRNAV